MRILNLLQGRALSLSGVRRAAAALAAAVWVTGLAAQTPQTTPAPSVKPPAPQALPSARSIIDRHIDAVGGRKAILAHTSSHAVGTVTIAGSGISGSLDVYGAKPAKSLAKTNLGGIGDVMEGFDGTVAWSLNPITGPMLAQGKELEEKKFDADFYGDLRDPERFASIKTVEKLVFEGRPAYKISLVRKDGGEDFDFYDVATGLKSGAIGTRESPMGPMTVTQSQWDYKKFGGVLVPTTMKQTAGGMQQLISITSVEFDNVPPTLFDPPAQIKALIK